MHSPAVAVRPPSFAHRLIRAVAPQRPTPLAHAAIPPFPCSSPHPSPLLAPEVVGAMVRLVVLAVAAALAAATVVVDPATLTVATTMAPTGGAVVSLRCERSKWDKRHPVLPPPSSRQRGVM